VLRRDGMTEREAITKAAGIAPCWYALQRLAWTERWVNEVTGSAPSHLGEAWCVIRRLGQRRSVDCP
jgi:hypothetical protein